MYKVHWYLGAKMFDRKQMDHIPNMGDTIRLAHEKYAKVYEITFCLDEPSAQGQRVNIGMRPLRVKKARRGDGKTKRTSVTL